MKLLRNPQGKVVRQDNGKIRRGVPGAPCCQSCIYLWTAIWNCNTSTWQVYADYVLCSDCPEFPAGTKIPVYDDWYSASTYAESCTFVYYYAHVGTGCVCTGTCTNWPDNPAPPTNTPQCAYLWNATFDCVASQWTVTLALGLNGLPSPQPLCPSGWTTDVLGAHCWTTSHTTPPDPPTWTPVCHKKWAAVYRCNTHDWAINWTATDEPTSTWTGSCYTYYCVTTWTASQPSPPAVTPTCNLYYTIGAFTVEPCGQFGQGDWIDGPSYTCSDLHGWQQNSDGSWIVIVPTVNYPPPPPNFKICYPFNGLETYTATYEEVSDWTFYHSSPDNPHCTWCKVYHCGDTVGTPPAFPVHYEWGLQCSGSGTIQLSTSTPTCADTRGWTNTGICADYTITATSTAPALPSVLPVCVRVYHAGCDAVVHDDGWQCMDLDTYNNTPTCTWSDPNPITCERTWIGDENCPDPPPGPDPCPNYVYRWAAYYSCATATWSVGPVPVVVLHAIADWTDVWSGSNRFYRRYKWTVENIQPDPPTDTPDCSHMYCVTRKQCDPSGRGWNTTTTLVWTADPEQVNTWIDEGTGWFAYWVDLGFTLSNIPTQDDYNHQTPELSNPPGPCSLFTGECVIKRSIQCGAQEYMTEGWYCAPGSHVCCKTELFVNSSSTSAGLTLNCWINAGNGVWYMLYPMSDCSTGVENWVVCTPASAYGIPGMNCDNWVASEYCKVMWHGVRRDPVTGNGCYTGGDGEWDISIWSIPFCEYEDIDDNTWIAPTTGCVWTYRQRVTTACNGQTGAWCRDHATFPEVSPPNWP